MFDRKGKKRRGGKRVGGEEVLQAAGKKSALSVGILSGELPSRTIRRIFFSNLSL